MTRSPDDLSPIALAYMWVSRITTACVEMIAPGLAGLWVDGKLGTKFLFTLLGFAVGMTLGIWRLIRITASNGDDEGPEKGQPSR